MQADEDSIKALMMQKQAGTFRENRKLLGLTQEGMAEVLQRADSTVTDRTVKRWEKGETPVPAWALALQEDMKEYFEKHEALKSVKNAILGATDDASTGFFGHMRQKLRQFIKG